MLLDIIKLTQELGFDNVTITKIGKGTKVSVNSLNIVIAPSFISFIKDGEIDVKCRPDVKNTMDLVRKHLEKEKFPRTITIKGEPVTVKDRQERDIQISSEIFDHILKELEKGITSHLVSFNANKTHVANCLKHVDLTCLVEQALDPNMARVREDNTIDSRFNIQL